MIIPASNFTQKYNFECKSSDQVKENNTSIVTFARFKVGEGIEVEVKDGERQTVEKKMYAGYILVSMILDDQTWYNVRNTPGVTGFISAEDEKDTRPKPVPLSDSEVEHIFSRMNADSPRVRVGFNEGDSVKITDGPFAEFLGTVEYVDEDKGKARVLVSFFGRDTPVDLDFLQLERN